jgi:SAM-dependent methyltransferase
VGEEQHIEQFWDARAREDAFYFVDNRLDYRNPDVERFWERGREDLDQLLAAVGASLRPHQSVVDIGCGVGRLTRALAAQVEDVVAIDVSGEMLQRAREHNAHLDNVRWVHGDGSTLTGIGDACADAVVSHVVFQHIPDPQITLGYIREIGRVLRPGGWAAFQVSNDPAVHDPARYAVSGRLDRVLRRAPRGTADRAWIGSMVDLDELAAVGSAAGMDVEAVAGAGTQFCVVRLSRRFA